MFILLLCLLTTQLFASFNISDLISISGSNDLSEGSIKLIWTYPGADILPEGSRYYIQYSTFSEISWSTSTAQIVLSTGPVYPGEQQLVTISGLDKFVLNNSLSKYTTFYFVVFISSSDESVSLSNTATGWFTLWRPYINIKDATGGIHEGKIELEFEGSDDYINGTITGALSGYFYIQYTEDENFNNWSPSAAQVKISTWGYPSYIWSAKYTLTGLNGGVTYYIRMWAEDELGNISEISNKVTTIAQPDISPPRRITSILVSAGFRHIKLNWILPYEDSYEDGFLYNSSSYSGGYKIRYHRQQINNESLWSEATEVFFIENVNVVPNASTSVVITGLLNNNSYYFSIKTKDERNNWSLISSSSPYVVPFNSLPSCYAPLKHFVYDPVRNTTSTVISSTTVKIDWSEAGWHAGISLSDASNDSDYGDFISSYTLKISTYITSNILGHPVINLSTTQTYVIVENLLDDTTYYWTLTTYDSEGASSTTAIFKFIVNFKNTSPKFHTNPLISPINTVVHTNTGQISFDFKDAYDVDPYDYVIGYEIFLSTSESFENYIKIPKEGLLTTSYFLMTPYTQPSSNELLDYENKKIYWYVVTYDSGSFLGFPQLSTQTPLGWFWINQKDEPICDFEVFFPTGTPTILKGATFYKIVLEGTTYYPLMEKVINNDKIFIAKSTPIILCWQPTFDPDPQDGVYEYAVFISSWREPKNEANAWRYVANPNQNAPPFEYEDWFKRWDFFVSTAITKIIEEGTQEGYDLKIIENATYFFRIRALDAPQNLYWIWTSTETFSPPLSQSPKTFCIDFLPQAPFDYNIVKPTGIINPISLEGPIYFEWTKPKDPDPFDSVKHYFLNISTFLPQTCDGWYTLALWKLNIYLENPQVTSTTVMFTFPKLCPSVTYYWQIHCWGENEWNFSLNPSTSQPYLVKPYGVAFSTGYFVISNQKPYKFNLLSPGVSINSPFAVGIKTFRPTFYWEQVYDPDNYDPIISSYVLVISSRANFYFQYSFYSSTTSFVLNFDLQPRTTYFWYVKAYDRFGNFQTPYSTFYFQTTNFEPRNFELEYPINDEVVNTTNPKFKFKNKGDPDEDIVFYTLYISSMSDFSVYEKYEDIASNLGKQLNSTIEIEVSFDFKENTQYFWQVVANDKYGGVSSSTVSSFWINSIEEEPKSFYVNITSGVIKERNIFLSWQPSYESDPKDYIHHYRIVISTFDSYVVGHSTYIIVLGSTTLNYNLDLSLLKENAIYYWWVEAYDSKGNYTKSISSYLFIVDLQDDLPDDFYLLSPGSTFTFTRIQHQPLDLTWTAANKTEWWKPINYKIFLGEAEKQTTNYFVLSLDPYKNYKEIQVISYSTSALKENTTYFWYVEAYNQIGKKTSQINYFFVDLQNDPPEFFEIYYPSGTVLTRNPKFCWSLAVDKDDNIVYYELKLSTRSNFPSKITTTTIISSTVSVHTIEYKLLMNTTYYWKIVAYDSRGLWRDSNVFQFYVPYFRPNPVEILSPKGEVNLRKPVFKWSPSSHQEPNTKIIKYRLKVFSKEDFSESIIDVEVSTTTYQPQINLTQNTTYYYEVLAIDEEGISSDANKESFFVGIINIPSRVEKITYQQQQYRFILYWQKVQTYTDGSSADDIKGYNIYRSQDYETLLSTDTVYKFVSSTITMFIDYIYFTTYYYFIKAITYGDIESAPSDVITSFNSGSRIIPLEEIRMIIPKFVDEEILDLGYKIQVATMSVKEEDIDRLNVIMRYKLEVIKNNKNITYTLPQPISLEISLKNNFQEDYLNNDKFRPLVFFNNGVEYVLIPTYYEKEKNILRCTLKNTGEYVIRKVIHFSEEPAIVNIYPRKIFTPLSPKNNKIHFVIFNPTLSTPEGEVYDLNLRYVAKLKLEDTELVWDGRYDNKEVVPKGIYIYKIKIGNKTFTGTIIVAK
ncbi:MAG: hypothetical protein N2505_01020 [Endomicrobia bacterium]|nr:hypothetical protein [Endomicrobiia bacterium]